MRESYNLSAATYAKVASVTSRRTIAHHVKPDSPTGLQCSRLCMLSSMLRNASIRKIEAYYAQHGTYKADNQKCEAAGFPVLGKDAKGNQMYYKGYVYSLATLYHVMKDSPEFRCGENTKMIKSVLQSVGEEYKGWMKACAAYKKNPKKFKAPPRRPKYKGMTGQYKIALPYDAVSTSANSGYFTLANTGIEIPNIGNEEVAEIEINPSRYGYRIIVSYVNISNAPDIRTSHDHICGLDFGLAKAFTLASNHSDLRPTMVKGGHLRYINRKAERAVSKLREKLPKGVTGSKKIDRIVQKQRNRTDTLIHTMSRRVAEFCYVNGISLLVCGYNAGWKQGVNLGSKTNARFTRFPYRTLLNQITYKCRDDGIVVLEREESYTSKTSFVDGEAISKSKDGEYSGKRVVRGMFRTAEGLWIHADVNGALNIMRKQCGEGIFDEDRTRYIKNAQHIPLNRRLQSGNHAQGNRHQPGAFQPERAG